MLTIVLYAVVAVVVVGALVGLAVVVLPPTEQLAPAPADRAPWSLPRDRAMSEGDVTRMRLPVALRGYRFAETDAALDRLGEEIAHRDRMILALQQQLDLLVASDGVASEGAPAAVPAADTALPDAEVGSDDAVGLDAAEIRGDGS